LVFRFWGLVTRFWFLVRNAFGEIAYNLNKKACEDRTMEKRKNDLDTDEIKHASQSLGLLITIGILLTLCLCMLNLRFTSCIPTDSGYTPQVAIPSQAVEVHEGLQLIRGSYTIQNFSQMEVMEFFEAELETNCTLFDGIGSCSGEVDELTDFYIFIEETNLENQSTHFVVSFSVPWCDEWPE
jgi:hypothetical protein